MDHHDLKSSFIDCGLQLEGGEAAPSLRQLTQPWEAEIGLRLEAYQLQNSVLDTPWRCPKASSYHLEATTRA